VYGDGQLIMHLLYIMHIMYVMYVTYIMGQEAMDRPIEMEDFTIASQLIDPDGQALSLSLPL
jgi:hypothetical protein